jgi:hypothetical protein
MAVRSKTGTAALQHQPGKPKLTRQGKWRYDQNQATVGSCMRGQGR